MDIWEKDNKNEKEGRGHYRRKSNIVYSENPDELFNQLFMEYIDEELYIKKLTQKDLANMAKIGAQTVSRIMNCKVTPTSSTITSIIYALGGDKTKVYNNINKQVDCMLKLLK